VAKRNGLEVLDLHAVITDEKLMFSDGVHPNQHGAKKLAEAVAETIKNQNKRK
jgi:lysophospholipase L1-like esterase